jgi:hypothetical protein
MLIAVGLVVLAAALVIGISGVLDNRGPSHSLTQSFAVLGHHFNGSSGRLFLYGGIVGAIGLASLLVFLVGVRRAVQRSRRTRRELKEARQATEAIAMDRDQLAAAQRRRPAEAANTAAPAVDNRVGDGRQAPFDPTRESSFFEPMPPPQEVATHRAP